MTTSSRSETRTPLTEAEAIEYRTRRRAKMLADAESVLAMPNLDPALMERLGLHAPVGGAS